MKNMTSWKNITAETEINGARYCTTQEILDNSDIYVIDPKGIKDLKKDAAADIRLLQFYIYADADKRAARLLPAERLRPSLKPENKVKMNSLLITKIIMDGISSFTTTGILTLQ